jgi:large subunit ribosomal protein L5
MQSRTMSILEEKFKKEIAKDLQEKLGIKNSNAVPRLSKVVINMGIKDAVLDKKNIEKAVAVLTQITGQKPRINKAKKSIATFKLREGEEIGAMVTLRGKRMYAFYEKLVKIVFPRIRDFHGVKKEHFDGRGNYNLGFAESTVFPEIDPSKIESSQGLEITIVTTAKNNEEGIMLLEVLGMPFKK